MVLVNRYEKLPIFEESDGQCVCASWPGLIQLSTVLNLLLSPPLVFLFHRNFCINYFVLEVANGAHLFPSHRLPFDLTLLCLIIVLRVVLHQGLLRGAVHMAGEVSQSLSLIQQAPLEGCEAPPSSWTFRLMLVAVSNFVTIILI